MMLGSEESDRIETQKFLSEPPTEEGPVGFMLELGFKNGAREVFEVTKFDPVFNSFGTKIVGAVVEQRSVYPGAPLIQLIDWDEVQVVSIRSIEEGR